MHERARTIGRTVTLMLVAALFLTITFSLFGFSKSFVQNAVSGAIAGALSGLLICMAVCVLGPRLSSWVDTGRSGSDALLNAIVGGYAGLIITSILVTIAFTAVGMINHLSHPFLWGAVVGALSGWSLGAILGAIIGASWRQA